MGLGNTKIRELYETEYPTLFRIACASGLGRSFADDMVQESFQPYWSGEMIRRWQNTKICRAGW